MGALMDKLMLYLQYPFVRYALVVGIFIALASSLLGVTLVLKRLSFIGTGLANVGFGTVSIATIFHFTSNMLLVAPVTVLCAIWLMHSRPNKKISGDAAIAMLCAGAGIHVDR